MLTWWLPGCMLLSADFFSKVTLSKIPFKSISVSISLDTDQDRQNVGLDLGPNSLQRSSVDLELARKELVIVQTSTRQNLSSGFAKK